MKTTKAFLSMLAIVSLSLILAKQARADRTTVISTANIKFTGLNVSVVTAGDGSQSWILNICATTTQATGDAGLTNFSDCKQATMAGTPLANIQTLVTSTLLPWWQAQEGL